jgi:endonuclease/exonuclease/phosphatase family metal-dependent hydrolase
MFFAYRQYCAALVLATCGSLLASGACIGDADYDDDGGNGGAGGSGGSLPTEPIPFSVVTWNTKNLFNNQNDSAAPQEEIDNNWPTRRAEVGRVVNALDADFVVLQEVEHDIVVNELNEVELAGKYAHIAVSEGNDPRGIDVGVMSKYPLDQVVTHAEEGFVQIGTSSPLYKFARDAFEVHITVNQRHVVFIGVHFKAKDNDDPEKRLAEAQRTRQIADAIAADDPQAAIVVLGDFNDLPQSPPYEAISAGSPSFQNAALSAPTADQYTFEFGGQQELVDHMMINPLMAERLDPATVKIDHGPEAEAASDHSPVFAGFMID